MQALPRRTLTFVLPAKGLTYSFTTKDKISSCVATQPTPVRVALSSCTTGKERLISRWEHEAVLETVQARLDHHPEKMTMRLVRRQNIRSALSSAGWSTHFLTKRLPRVATDMALNVLAYNIKRVMAIIGVVRFIEVSWQLSQDLRDEINPWQMPQVHRAVGAIGVP